ncbi:MAG: hypothetical protein Q9205_004143 [Flavoplaca limonia]
MPEGKSTWTETEKLALMVSIVGSLGAAPKWDLVKLPAGRSKMACMHAYRAVMEAAKGVTLGDNQNADAVKKRPKKSQPSKNATTSKGKRNRNDDEVQQSDVSETEKPKAKKPKTEDDEKPKAKKLKTENDEKEV